MACIKIWFFECTLHAIICCFTVVLWWIVEILFYALDCAPGWQHYRGSCYYSDASRRGFYIADVQCSLWQPGAVLAVPYTMWDYAFLQIVFNGGKKKDNYSFKHMFSLAQENYSTVHPHYVYEIMKWFFYTAQGFDCKYKPTYCVLQNWEIQSNLLC